MGLGLKALAGTVDLEVGGASLKLYLGINEMIRLSADLGVREGEDGRFFEILDDLTRNPSVAKLRSVFYHALTKHQPDVTEDDAGDLMTALGMDRMGEVLGDLLKWATPDAPKGGDGEGSGRPSSGPTSSQTRPDRASRRQR